MAAVPWQCLDAIEDIDGLADDVEGELKQKPTSASLRKLASALGELATYITNVGHVVNYGERFRAGYAASVMAGRKSNC